MEKQKEGLSGFLKSHFTSAVAGAAISTIFYAFYASSQGTLSPSDMLANGPLVALGGFVGIYLGTGAGQAVRNFFKPKP